MQTVCAGSKGKGRTAACPAMKMSRAPAAPHSTKAWPPRACLRRPCRGLRAQARGEGSELESSSQEQEAKHR